MTCTWSTLSIPSSEPRSGHAPQARHQALRWISFRAANGSFSERRAHDRAYLSRRLTRRAVALALLPLVVSLSNHEPSARPSAFAEATADRRSAKREGWSTSAGRALRQFDCSPGLVQFPDAC